MGAIYKGFNGIKAYSNSIFVNTLDGGFKLPSENIPTLANAISTTKWNQSLDLSSQYRVIMPNTTMEVLLKGSNGIYVKLLELDGSNLKMFQDELNNYLAAI